MNISGSLRQLGVVLAIALFSCPILHAAANPDVKRWQQEGAHVNIVRDNWGIAHIYGKTDADAVFGMEYAQAEDDFSRVETNYLNAMGRLAETAAQNSFMRPRDIEHWEHGRRNRKN